MSTEAGVGHQVVLLSCALLGGQFVGYNSFFVLQVMALSFFVLIKRAAEPQLYLSRPTQAPACACQGCSRFSG